MEPPQRDRSGEVRYDPDEGVVYLVLGPSPETAVSRWRWSVLTLATWGRTLSSTQTEYALDRDSLILDQEEWL